MSDSLDGWTQIEIVGHRCDLYLPPQADERGDALLYLHDVDKDRLPSNEVLTRLLAEHSLPAIAPQTGRSWWSDRPWPQFDPERSVERFLIDDVVAYAAAQLGAQPPQLALLGQGMGGHGALRLAFKHPDVFAISAAIAPTIDHYQFFDQDATLPSIYRDSEQVRQDSATLHVHPLNWPRNLMFTCDPNDPIWHAGSERLQMKLGSLGIPYQSDLDTEQTDEATSYFDQMAPQAVEFLVTALDRERRRIA